MSKNELAKKVVIGRHRFVLDWFEIDQVEIEIKRDQFFEFNYRFDGDWYLAQHDHDGKEYVCKDWGRGDFRLQRPHEALTALGDKVIKFTAITTNMGFHKALAKLMADASEVTA